MKTTEKPFLALTAQDLMSRVVLLVPREMSLRGAAHLLRQARVSGAPVVDAAGRCVGVLSSTDIVRWVERDFAACGRPAESPAVCSDWQIIDWKGLPTDAVSSCMSAELVTATPYTRIADLARGMNDAHVHRIVVVDENDRPVGIVSSTDILAAVAGAADWQPDRAVGGRRAACLAAHG
jgi:CBS domain-containing protein